MIPKDDVIYRPFSLLSMIGLHPHSYLGNFRVALNIIPYLILITLSLMGIYIFYHGDDLNVAVECFLTTVLLAHSLGRHIAFSINRKIWANLLDMRTKFWPIETPLTREYLERISKFTNYYMLLGLITAFVFCIQPFITGKPPSTVYVPPGWRHAVDIAFFYLAFCTFASNYGVDTTFFTISMCTFLQFEQLKEKFLKFNFSDRDCKKKLAHLINYHDLLLRYCSEINRGSRFVFLHQFIVTICACCFQLYITLGDFVLANKIKCMIYFAAQCVQTGLYCISAELLSSASLDIAKAIYESNWYLIRYTPERKFIISIIARAQRKMIFSGFGLVLVNLETFTVVLKTALSFYTYLSTVSE